MNRENRRQTLLEVLNPVHPKCINNGFNARHFYIYLPSYHASLNQVAKENDFRIVRVSPFSRVAIEMSVIFSV